MKSKPLAVGDPIDASCTKCRMITNHIIVALTDSKPAKVQCNTCQGQHRYRSPKTGPQEKTKRTIKTSRPEQNKWSELRPQMKVENARVYSMEQAYKSGEVIRHPQFGIGQVQLIVGNRKMEVLFEDGLKTMRCK